MGEFHYLHHQPDGTPYDDPNAMGQRAARRRPARRACGSALLDTCYLSSGFGEPPEGVQVRFSDGDADAWAERVRCARRRTRGVGAAIHSVRAVPARPAAARSSRPPAGRPLHVHLSEQVAENDACLAAYGVTPTQLLAEAGVLGPLTSAVHATHLTDDDVGLLGAHAHLRLLLPHHRARPRRRHRPEPRRCTTPAAR